MRNLKLQMQVSLDGYVAGPQGEMDWMTWDWDDILKDYVMGITEPVDCIVLGRVLAQGFINHWAAIATNPESTDVFSRKMHETSKIVFTKTLHTHEWHQTALADGDLVETIRELKNEEGQDIIAYGGGNFVSSLIREGLIDEFHLFINPVALGSGMPIFQDLQSKASLQLLEARSFSCGIALLRYKSLR